MAARRNERSRHVKRQNTKTRELESGRGRWLLLQHCELESDRGRWLPLQHGFTAKRR